MLEHDLTLKNNELCLVGRPTDRGGMHESGLYLRDTRFLSGCRLATDGGALETLTVETLSATEAVVTQTIGRDHPTLPAASLAVRTRVILATAVGVRIEVTAFDRSVETTRLQIELAADFRDMFDVRGMTPKERPHLDRPVATPDGVRFEATGTDNAPYLTAVTASPIPSTVDIAMVKRGDGLDPAIPAMLAFDLDFRTARTQAVTIEIAPRAPGEPHRAADDALTRLEIRSDNRNLGALLHRADLDLAMLQTDFPEGAIPAAGIPWFIAPFGRDSLIVALQTMHVYPERVWATLNVLAANQGTKIDPWREEEPGKILHEMRYGDMARTGQAPHGPYFGSIDSTPLFVMTFAQAWLWHRDEDQYERLLPHVDAALDWIEQFGDLDGDGLVEFGAKLEDGLHITQQGWKDSHDSLHFANGDPVEGPIALVEVQGYVYAAYAGMAEVASERGDSIRAEQFREKADRVRNAVEAQYWLESEGYYAQALDGAKRAVDAISSNPGHLLFCGLPSRERAQRMVDRLLRPDMLTRWGIRTLSSEMATYNPMSYHNGSIWPHDNSLAMWGCKAYGFNEAASAIAECLVRLASHDPGHRLSELYCGFDLSDEREGPVPYPVSCRPQAWAAGCGPLLVRTIFGFDRTGETYGMGTESIGTDLVSHMSVDGLRALGEEWVLRMSDRYGFEMHVSYDGFDEDDLDLTADDIE